MARLVPVGQCTAFKTPISACGQGGFGQPARSAPGTAVFDIFDVGCPAKWGRGVQIMLYLASYVVYLALQIPGSLLDGLFHLSQFIQAGYVANFGLEIVDVALGTAYQRTQGASNAGKFFRADNDQGDDANQGQLGNAQINHVQNAMRYFLGLGPAFNIDGVLVNRR
jgi:hypothetical protein